MIYETKEEAVRAVHEFMELQSDLEDQYGISVDMDDDCVSIYYSVDYRTPSGKIEQYWNT